MLKTNHRWWDLLHLSDCSSNHFPMGKPVAVVLSLHPDSLLQNDSVQWFYQHHLWPKRAVDTTWLAGNRKILNFRDSLRHSRCRMWRPSNGCPLCTNFKWKCWLLAVQRKALGLTLRTHNTYYIHIHSDQSIWGARVLRWGEIR